MNFQVKQGEKNQVIIEGEIAVAEMELALKLAARKISQNVNIPGFRKGKAPRSVVEGHVGVQAVLEQAAEDIIPRAYMEAVNEHKLDPIANPDLQVTQLEKDKPLLFTATVTVKPEVQLGEYKGMEAEKNIYQVADKDIDAELERARTRAARMVEVADGDQVEKGDQVNINFTGLIDGEEFPGGKADNFPLEIGSGAFIPGFEDQIIGMKKGEEKDVDVTFPEDYHEEKYAAKPALFKVKLNEIKRKELPVLNDDFAKEISETADTLEQLKEETRERLQQSYQKAAEEAVRAQIIKKVVDNAEVDIPDLMVDMRVDEMIQDLTYRLESQGLKLDMYMEYAKTDLEKMREDYRPQAQDHCKSDLVMEAIANQENIQIPDEEINQQIEMLAASYQRPADEIRTILERNGGINNITASMRLMKAGQLVVDNAEIKEVNKTIEKAEDKKEKKSAKKTTKKTADKTVDKTQDKNAGKTEKKAADEDTGKDEAKPVNKTKTKKADKTEAATSEKSEE